MKCYPATSEFPRIIPLRIHLNNKMLSSVVHTGYVGGDIEEKNTQPALLAGYVFFSCNDFYLHNPRESSKTAFLYFTFSSFF